MKIHFTLGSLGSPALSHTERHQMYLVQNVTKSRYRDDLITITADTADIKRSPQMPKCQTVCHDIFQNEKLVYCLETAKISVWVTTTGYCFIRGDVPWGL